MSARHISHDFHNYFLFLLLYYFLNIITWKSELLDLSDSFLGSIHIYK